MSLYDLPLSFALVGLAKFTFLDVDADDDVGFQRLLVPGFHISHETIRRF